MRKAESYFALDEAHQIANKMGYTDLYDFLRVCFASPENHELMYAWYQCVDEHEAATILAYSNDFVGHIPADFMPQFIAQMEHVAFGH